MGSSDRVSSAEAAALYELADRSKGEWREDDKPLWDNRHWTLALLNKLAKRGLVDEVEPDVHYRLSQHGHLWVNGR